MDASYLADFEAELGEMFRELGEDVVYKPGTADEVTVSAFVDLPYRDAEFQADDTALIVKTAAAGIAGVANGVELDVRGSRYRITDIEGEGQEPSILQLRLATV